MTTLDLSAASTPASIPRLELGAELVAQAVVECPVLADVGPREQLLAAAWLVGYQSGFIDFIVHNGGAGTAI